MKSDRDELQSIVERSNLSEEWKKILRETFAELSKRNDVVLDEIRRRALREDGNLRADLSDGWDVVTALMPSDQVDEMTRFYEVLKIREQKADVENLLAESLCIDLEGGYFLDCSYAEANALCADEFDTVFPYQGYIKMDGERMPFHYRLVRNLRYIERERQLWGMAHLYHIARPAIFSPYARRAVKIQIPQEEREIADHLREYPQDAAPFCFADNGLEDKILCDRHLLWNVIPEKKELPPYGGLESDERSYFAPYGDQEIYRYEFSNVKENEFICPAHEDRAAVIAAEKDRENGRIILITKCRLQSECMSMRILPLAEDVAKHCEGAGKVAFANRDACREHSFPKERLRTQGDIERVLYALSMPDFSCSFAEVSSTVKTYPNVIVRYSNELRYGDADILREQLLYGKTRRLPYCYLRFSGESKFLNDYAEYVLSFLEYRYPDVQWVGVM